MLCLLFPSSGCMPPLHYLSLEAESPTSFPVSYLCSMGQWLSNPFSPKLQKIEASHSRRKDNFHQIHNQGKSLVCLQKHASSHEIHPRVHQRPVFYQQPF